MDGGDLSRSPASQRWRRYKQWTVKPRENGGGRRGSPARSVVTGGLAAALAVIKQALEEKAASMVEVDGLAARVMAAPRKVRMAIEVVLDSAKG